MTPPANVITLHPGAVKRYLAMVDDLATSLLHRTVSGDEGISIALREPVSCVTVTPVDKGPPRSPLLAAWRCWLAATCSRMLVVI
jgi:hypothetical protein